MRVDSHQHFWRYRPEEYAWIGPDMAALRRDFLPEDWQAEAGAAGTGGAVAVQARQSVAETAWLLELARGHRFIKGVVGWVPLISPGVEADLACFAAQPGFKGVRHVLQGEPDGYLERADFNAGIGALRRFGLAYDLLIHARQLPATALADRHPAQMFVLDHLAKPPIRAGRFEPWNREIRRLAERPNVYCKVAGMVTEADWTAWREDGLRPYFDTVWEAFGPWRLMFGSDWPVCLAAAPYRRWTDAVGTLAAQATDAERQRLFGGTATEAYQLAA